MSDRGEDRDARPPPQEHRTPRWVKITVIIVLVLVLLLITVLAFGGGPGEHGPGRHAGSDGTAHGENHTALAGASRHGENHTPPGEGGRRGPVTWTVEVQDDAFAPETLTIQAGDTVEWTHAGENPHTVTADDGSFDSHPDCSTLIDGALGNCMSGGTYNRRFEDPGDVTYRCKLHGDNGMEGTIEVRQTYNETPGGRHH